MLIIIISSLVFTIAAQSKVYNYEPSAVHPYGLPNPDAPEQIKDYNLMIGECHCLSTSRNQDQSWADPIEMVWRWKYILNGMGVQDETLKSDGGHSGSIRQYNQDSSRWYVHYYSSKAASSTLSTWEGSKTSDGDIVLYKEQPSPTGAEGNYRLTFSNINESGYDWVGEWVNLDETIVYPTWKITCKR